MPHALSAIARRFLLDQTKLREQLKSPLLVLERPPLEQEAVLLLGTAGSGSPKPRSGEGLLYEIKKTAQAQNAFPMGVTLGRTENNDIMVEDNSVSRFHAFFLEDERTRTWKVADADSKLGTWVGPVRLPPRVPSPLIDLSRLRFGEIELFFMLPATFFEYLQGHIRP